MQYSDQCPVCGKRLELKQINLTEAILICTDMSCSYPVGGQCIVVKRKLEDIDKPVDIYSLCMRASKPDPDLNFSETSKVIQEKLISELEEILANGINGDRSDKDTLKPYVSNNVEEFKLEETIGSSNAGNDQTRCLELPELDEFLIDLLQ